MNTKVEPHNMVSSLDLKYYECEVNNMIAAFLIPLKVFGLGFIISMCMAVVVKFVLVAIKFFMNTPVEVQE
jgi:hypothetical protein